MQNLAWFIVFHKPEDPSTVPATTPLTNTTPFYTITLFPFEPRKISIYGIQQPLNDFETKFDQFYVRLDFDSVIRPSIFLDLEYIFQNELGNNQIGNNKDYDGPLLILRHRLYLSRDHKTMKIMNEYNELLFTYNPDICVKPDINTKAYELKPVVSDFIISLWVPRYLCCGSAAIRGGGQRPPSFV